MRYAKRNLGGSLLLVTLAALFVWAAACGTPGETETVTVRLTDLFQPAEGPAAARKRPVAGPEWSFKGPPPPETTPFASTYAWEPGPGVDLRVENGLLVGTAGTDVPIVRMTRVPAAGDRDLLQAIEVRLRASAGSNLEVQFFEAEQIPVQLVHDSTPKWPWPIRTPLVAGDGMRTYTLTSRFPVEASKLRHIFIRPTDAAGATFAIESVRLIFRRDHLESIPSGVSWQGLDHVFQETLVTRAPETVKLNVKLPSRPVLDLALGMVQEDALTFRVRVARLGDGEREGSAVLERTVTRPHRWEDAMVDLSAFAGEEVVLSLSLDAPQKGMLGFWGSPVVRSRIEPEAGSGSGTRRPRGVILVVADTLRRDHLQIHGYRRATMPTLQRLASEGVVFQDCIAQAPFTKASFPSLLASLYVRSHGVVQRLDRLPASATTLAEVFRSAGYATLSLSSIGLTGSFTNLHQGFEEVHEDLSLDVFPSSKTARELADRLLPWIEARQDIPFFVMLHVFDPHSPYEPYNPYNELWADLSHKQDHLLQGKELQKVIADPIMRALVMPSREEFERAGIDTERYISHERDWYDGSIRAMDVELGRVVERLRELGLEDDVLIAFTSDHGEEFLEHGRMNHGQSVYGELINVPLVLWGPGALPRGLAVDATVEGVDVMPTLLELAGLPVPKEAQGESLVPLIQAVRGEREGGRAGVRERPAISEKPSMPDLPGAGMPPRSKESVAIILDGWKLIHNTKRVGAELEYELYHHRKDPLDRMDLASRHPEVVQRLARALDEWRISASRQRLRPETEALKEMSPEQLQRLRSLGYIQ